LLFEQKDIFKKFLKTLLADRRFVAIGVLLLSMVALSFFSRIWDPDFFWHLATGRWIVQNLALPDSDPFTSAVYGTDREALILKGYWITQTLYYLLYSALGYFGLALFKSLCFVGLFAVIIRYHATLKTQLGWMLVGILTLYDVLLRFRADRPNMISLLFFAVLLYLLETRRWKTVPWLMIFWANMHGGFLLGDVVIGLYLVGLILHQRTRFDCKILFWGVLSLAVSFINPLGVVPFKILLQVQGSLYQEAVMEFMSPLRLATEFGDLYLGYLFALLLCLIALLRKWNKVAWPWALVLVFTSVISLMHARYIPFMVIASAFFAPQLLNDGVLPLWARQLLASVAMALFILLFSDDVLAGRGLTYGLEPDRFPIKAADFIEKQYLTRSILPLNAWGGYLLWRLPKHKIQDDTRALSVATYMRNIKIQKGDPQWRSLLEQQETELVVTSAFSPIAGDRLGFWQAVNDDPLWQLIYLDDRSLIYARRDIYQQQSVKGYGYGDVLAHALFQAQRLVKKYPQTSRHWADLGYINVIRGEIPAAIEAYQKTLSVEPGNEGYRTRLDLLQRR